MLLCKEHLIHLFLPANASHILQPLGLAPFSVVKGAYRSRIQDLAVLDDAAPVKKERFIQIYKEARDKGLSSRVIRAGWRASGMVPYNPSIPLQSSLVKNPPLTPPPIQEPQDPFELTFKTPTRSQNIYLAQQLLQASENLSRGVRVLLSKAGKSVQAANIRAAAAEAANDQLRAQLHIHEDTMPRKRVNKAPNERFAEVNRVVYAQEHAAAEAAKRASKAAENAAAKDSIQAQQASFNSLCSEFYL